MNGGEVDYGGGYFVEVVEAADPVVLRPFFADFAAFGGLWLRLWQPS